MTTHAQHRPTNWLGLFLALALLAMLLQAGSPGFVLADDGVWTLAKHFPKSTQKKIEKDQKKKRAEGAKEKARSQSTPRIEDIPNVALGAYQEFAGPDWVYVAGIYKIESDHGQSNAPGVKSGRNAHGCCAGPGQFNLDSGTWQSWRRSPDANVYDIRDSVPATIDMLRAYRDMPANHRHYRGNDCADSYGLERRWVNAIKHYNNACWYVAKVASWIHTYNQADDKPAPIGDVPKGLTFTTTHGCNPARDWERGAWTPEVRGFLIKLAEKFSFRVSCGAEGHSRYVKGTNRQSAHWTGRAFDVDMVNGRAITQGDPQDDFGRQALGFGARQVGGPSVLCNERTPSGGKRCFTDGGHKGHWHIQP